MVNDDKPFLQLTDHGVLSYGSPWSGKHGLASNVCVPLKGICSLRRGSENRIEPEGAKALLELLGQQVHIPEDEALAQKATSLLVQLLQTVPLWNMTCNKELAAAKTAYSAMSGYPE
jgi:hypothetical protein